jgi:hypothetical protein
MKRLIIFLTLVGISKFSFAQIYTQGGVNNTVSGSNVLLDGSSVYSTEAGAGAYVGKGVIIPSVDLVNFQFDLTLADGFTFPTYFDGMIVYNNATGTTLTTGNRSSTATAVTPGFYYFSNPNGANSGNVTGGEWKAIGGSNLSLLGIRSTTSATALTASDYTLLCNATAGGFTVTLPAASSNTGRIYVVRKTDEGSNAVTFSSAIRFSETSNFTSLNYPRTIRIQSDGANWRLIE